MNHWPKPRNAVRVRKPYGVRALAREVRDVEKMDAATQRAVEARHPSAYHLWAVMDMRPERRPVETDELREGVPPHLEGAI